VSTKGIRNFVEGMYYHPKGIQYFIILTLLPFSFLYGTFMFVRRSVARRKEFGLPIVSVGNLIVGGSGKTPFVIALASRYENVFVISRGYGRKSRGLVEVSDKGKIVVSVKESGDEAMLMAQNLPNASVVVSENREEAIIYAKGKGAGVIVLDDGFNRINIKKFEILLEPEHVFNILPFPAGPFRECKCMERYADMLLKEGMDYKRIVTYEALTQRMLLVTAIADPKRLESFLPEGVIGRYYLPDHAYFDEAELEKKMRETGAQSLLVTEKDQVKMKGFKLPVSKMKLKLEISKDRLDTVDKYIKEY